MNTLSSLKTWIRLILENEIDKTPNNAGVITPSIPQPKPKEDKPKNMLGSVISWVSKNERDDLYNE